MRTIAELFIALKQLWWRRTVPQRLRRLGIGCGMSCSFYGMPIVSMAPRSKISIGDRSSLISDCRFTALGVARPCILRTFSSDAQITIGSDTGLSGTVICSVMSVEIGANCLVGADVIIADTDFHPIDPNGRRYAKIASAGSAKIVIENNVFIGARSMILKGVRIGSNSVIGAGSIVTSNIPSGVVAAGNPARVIHKLTI